MIRKIKNIVWNILIKLKLGGAVQLMLTGGLLDDGWFNSFNTKQSIDKNNKPIPWCTYSFIKFIEPRLRKEFIVFEYGSGNSTLWYAKRVGKIIAVENDSEWFTIVSKSLPDNAKLIYSKLDYDGQYCRMVSKQDKKFNLIIIDGRDRVNCIKHSIDFLTEDGVIVFDNSQVPKYQSSVELLLNKGFRKIDFEGMLPILSHNNTTTIFYKDANCLGI